MAKRVIHVVVSDSDTEPESDERAKRQRLRTEDETIDVIDSDDDMGNETQVPFSLPEDDYSLNAPPTLLSQTPQGSGLTSATTTTSQPCGTQAPLARVPLRVLYWNIERFGGLAQWGLPETRADEVMAALARVIALFDPHLVVLVEVMAHKGAAEVERLRAGLAKLGKAWASSLAAGVTGATTGKAGTGETYAVLYRADVGIKPAIARIGLMLEGTVRKPFDTGQYTDSEGNAVEFRAPGEFVFDMGGEFALSDGTTWPLAIVAFHAPGPQAKRERQAKIEELIARLGKLEVVADRKTYPDCLICADLNSNPDAYNISKEPESHFDIAVWELDGSTGMDWVVEKALPIQQEEEDKAKKAGKKYGARDRKKVTTRVKTQLAEILGKREQEKRLALVREQFPEEARKPRSADVKEWRESVEAILDEIDALDAEEAREGLELTRLLIGAKSDEEWEAAEKKVDAATRRREEQLEELREALRLLDPRIEGIHYIEDVRPLIEQIRRPGTAAKKEVAQIKRDLTSQLKVDEEWEKFYYREEAYAPLEGIEDPLPSDVDGPEVDTLAGTGFFNTLSYDSDLMTTRRRSIAAWLRKNEQGGSCCACPPRWRSCSSRSTTRRWPARSGRSGSRTTACCPSWRRCCRPARSSDCSAATTPPAKRPRRTCRKRSASVRSGRTRR